MTTKHVKITDGAKEELRRATITGNQLDFVGVLKNYAEIKKLFPALGITWNKGKKTHIIEPTTPERIQEILGGAKIVDRKKTKQQFYTPQRLAQKVVELAELKPTDYTLEPSAGRGALLKEILTKTNDVYIVEIDEDNYNHCVNNYHCAGYIGDFLGFSLEEAMFDKIVANPPFSRNDWVKHIEHAWKFLKEGGRLVAICPNAKHNKFFQKFIDGKDYKIEDVEAGGFAESGTQIATMIVVINK